MSMTPTAPSPSHLEPAAAITVSPHRTGNHYAQLLWVVILLIALITFLVDIAGWFHTGWLLAP